MVNLFEVFVLKQLKNIKMYHFDSHLIRHNNIVVCMQSTYYRRHLRWLQCCTSTDIDLTYCLCQCVKVNFNGLHKMHALRSV